VDGGGIEPFTKVYAPFIHVGNFVSNWSFRLDGLSAGDAVVVTTVSSLVHLYSWGYMEGRSEQAAVLLLPVAVHLLDAEPDQRGGLHAAVLRLGRGRDGELFAHRLLVPQATANAAAIKAFVVNRVGDFASRWGS